MPKKPTADVQARFAAALAAHEATVKAAALKCNLPIPEDAGDLLRAQFYLDGDRWARYRNMPAKATDRARLLHRMVNWHRGDSGGSLWGPMGWQFELSDAAERERLENVAMLSLVLSGKRLAAAAAWAHALNGE
jgi:hypothetical protein